MTVNTVMPGTWAERNYLTNGDELVSINRKPVNGMSEIQFSMAMDDRPLSLQFLNVEFVKKQLAKIRMEEDSAAKERNEDDSRDGRVKRTTAIMIWEILGAALEKKSDQLSRIAEGTQSKRTAQVLKQSNSPRLERSGTTKMEERNLGSQNRQKISQRSPQSSQSLQPAQLSESGEEKMRFYQPSQGSRSPPSSQRMRSKSAQASDPRGAQLSKRSAQSSSSSPERRSPGRSKSPRTPRSQPTSGRKASPHRTAELAKARTRRGSSASERSRMRKQSPQSSEKTDRRKRQPSRPRRRSPVRKKDEVRGQLLQIEPKGYIHFAHGPVGDDCKSTVKLLNKSPGAIAFKVKTTAPKNYHTVRPASGMLRQGGRQEIAVILHARGQPEAVASGYSFLFQAVSLSKHNGSTSDSGDCDRDLNVEEHRLLVAFKDIDRGRPLELEETGVVTLAGNSSGKKHRHAGVDEKLYTTSNSVFKRLHADHDHKLEMLQNTREAKKAREIEEVEHRVQVQYAPSWVISEASDRLWAEHAKKQDRAAARKLYAEEEAAALAATTFNVKPDKIVEHYNDSKPHWERLFSLQQLKLKRLDDERARIMKEEEDYMIEHSIHRKCEGFNAERFELLYEDSQEREMRLRALIELEAQRDLESFVHGNVDNSNVNVTETTQRLYEDASRRREQTQQVQIEMHKEMLRSMDNDENQVGRDMSRHIERLYQDGFRRHKYRMVLRERWEQAHLEMLRSESVHATLPRTWTRDEVESIVSRLYPDVEVEHSDYLQKGDGILPGSKIPPKILKTNWGTPKPRDSPRASPRTPRTPSGPAMRPDPKPTIGAVSSSEQKLNDVWKERMLQDPILMGALIDEGATVASLPNDTGDNLSSPRSANSRAPSRATSRGTSPAPSSAKASDKSAVVPKTRTGSSKTNKK